MVNVKIEKPPLSLEGGQKGIETTGSGSFSLAHLSDPHLTSLTDIKFSQLANKRILGYLSWLRKRRFVHRREIVDSLVEDLHITRPDHIAVTGDPDPPWVADGVCRGQTMVRLPWHPGAGHGYPRQS